MAPKTIISAHYEAPTDAEIAVKPSASPENLVDQICIKIKEMEYIK